MFNNPFEEQMYEKTNPDHECDRFGNIINTKLKKEQEEHDQAFKDQICDDMIEDGVYP